MKYEVTVTGNENSHPFPYTVRDTESGAVFDSYSHRGVAEQIADRLNGVTAPKDIYDVTEADEMMIEHLVDKGPRGEARYEVQPTPFNYWPWTIVDTKTKEVWDRYRTEEQADRECAKLNGQ